jgi:mono/diheme cytochrome c family protein
MKKTVWVALFVLIVAALALTACGGGGGETTERQSPPADYANATNPFEGDAEAVTAGEALFATNCAGCHGDSGGGDGPAAASLDPKPANLQNTVAQAEPQYSHWVISEGGAAAGLSSSMPAFKGSLSDEDIWRIVTYMEESFQ